MFIYLFVVTLLLVLAFVFDYGNNESDKSTWQFIVVVLLILIAGLRYHIGGDSLNYEYEFYHFTPALGDIFVSRYLSSQFLWRLLMSFCYTYFHSFVALQLIHAFILNILLFRFIKKTTKYVFSALLIVFCVTWWNLSFEILRESLCVAIYLNAILSLKDRNYKSYIVLGLITMGLHWFSFVIVLITPILMFGNRKIVVSSIIIISVYLFLFVDDQFFVWLDILSEEYVGGGMSKQINAYTGLDGGLGRSVYNINGMVRIFMVYILFPIVTIYYSRKMSTDDDLNKLLILFVVFGVLQTKLVIFSRLYNYLNVLLIVYAVNIAYNKIIKNQLVRLMYVILIFIYLASGIMTFSQQKSNYVPYRSIFGSSYVINSN